MAALNDSDVEFLRVAMTCFKSPPQLDTTKLAEMLGVKPKSVTNRWWAIKKKLYPDGDAASTSQGKTDEADTDDDPKTPKAKRQGKKPTPRAKSTPGKRVKKGDTDTAEEGDGANPKTGPSADSKLDGEAKQTAHKATETETDDAC